jgi:hypothetical protein
MGKPMKCLVTLDEALGFLEILLREMLALYGKLCLLAQNRLVLAYSIRFGIRNFKI